MTQMTYYWHDYETFGLNRHLDRPVQFAGIRTDSALNVISEPDVFYCDCAPDYLPSPEACLITGITPQVAHARGGQCEAEFARRIRDIFRTPGTCSIGYNSLRFDDEVTRFLFWRNLMDPYAREWDDGCSRWDLFPLVQAVWALRPAGIVWPTVKTPEGAERISFRLEHLSAANGLEHSHAHDAMSDVYATLALARLIREKNPRFWQWAFENRAKAKVRSAFAASDGTLCRPAVWIDGRAGQEKGFIRIAFPICETDKKEIVLWDCREDPEELWTLDPETICRRAWKRSEMKEGETALSLFKLRPNQFPVVCANLNVLKQSAIERFSIDMNAVNRHMAWLSEHASDLAGPISLSSEHEPEKGADADCALYEGLTSNADRAVMQRTESLSPEALTEAVGEGRIHFEDPRLTELLWRKRARNWPGALTDDERIRWKAFCGARLQGLVPGTLSLAEYMNEVDAAADTDCQALEAGQMTEDQFEARQQILDDLYNWGEFVGSAAQDIDGETR